jgi:hypothetical protein
MASDPLGYEIQISGIASTALGGRLSILLITSDLRWALPGHQHGNERRCLERF